MKKITSICLALVLVFSLCSVFVAAKGSVNLAQGEGVTLEGAPKYPGYDGDLIDNQVGTDKYNNLWAGFYNNANNENNNYDGKNGIVVMDLGKVYANIDSIEAHIWDSKGASGIASPAHIYVSVSSDGVNYVDLGELTFSTDAIGWATLALSTPVNARFVKYNFDKGENGGVFMFVSELAVWGDGSEASAVVEDKVINLLAQEGNVSVTNCEANDLAYELKADGLKVSCLGTMWPSITFKFNELVAINVAETYLEIEATITGGNGGSIRLLGPVDDAGAVNTDDIYLQHFDADVTPDGGGDAPAGSTISYKVPVSELAFCIYDAANKYAGKNPITAEEISFSGLQVFASGKDCVVNITKLNLIVPGTASSVVKEEITVDGDLNDNGWAKDKWIVVDHETGYLQNTYEIQQGTAVAADFGYKYQLRTDDTKLYGAIVVDGAPVAGGNGKGTFPRLWIRDNDEATIYTSFFNIEFDADGNVITGAKYNTSTTENKGANIENSTFVAFAKEVDGKSVFEFSVDIAEFCADGTFDYFLSVSQLAGENYGCLYHPASEIGPTDPNGGANHIPHKYLPFNTWHTAKDATINVKDIALGEINVGNVIKEVVTVDGDVNDTGWAKKGWTTVSGENGSWQYPTKKEVAAGTPIPTFTYKFQLRADDAKLYGALVLDGVHEEEKNIKVRIWFRDNDEATVYSSFYDFVFAPDGTLTTAAKYNTSTTENKGAAIEPTTLEAVAKIVDGKTVLEFSVDVAEVTKDGNFDYFVSLERKQGVNTGTLYFPFIPEKDETSPHGNYPWLLWMAENDATVAVEDIVLGEIVVSDKEEADTSMMGTAPADPAFTVTLDTEKGWVAGEKLVVTATVDVLKDGVDLSQIMFNLFYDAADVEITLPEELGAIITSGKDSWKEDSLFTLSVDGEYGVIECAPATTVEADVLKKGDKLVMTFEFTVKDEAEGLINFQLSNKGLVGYSWDLDAAELAGAGSSLAVANEDALGDTGIYVIAALALVALIGTAIVIKKRA